MEQQNLEHKLFDPMEWLPCMVGIVPYRNNMKNELNKGLYPIKFGLLDNVHTLYQAGTLTAALAYVLLG